MRADYKPGTGQNPPDTQTCKELAEAIVLSFLNFRTSRDMVLAEGDERVSCSQKTAEKEEIGI